MRAAYFDCLSGASGNMLLGGLLDAGAPASSVEAAIAALGLAGHATLRVERRRRGSLDATHVEVDVSRGQPWRTVADIDRLIAGAPLEEGVRERSRLAFRLLARAEAEAHGVAIDDVRLHETGAVDAVVDVVGTFAAADALGVQTFYSSPLPLSDGTATSEHGEIPLPAPATLRILDAIGAPTYRKECGAELVTPTGAAIIGACALFQSPRISTDLEGFGAGSAELPWANVLRVVVGEVEDAAGAAPLIAAGGLPGAMVGAGHDAGAAAGAALAEETVAVLETAIDDMPANVVATLPADLLAAGALDAWLTPVLMKKGRPGHHLTVLCPPDLAAGLAERIVRQTSTLGVRVRDERRLVAGRRLERVATSLGEIAAKVKTVGGVDVDAVPEFDDVHAAAERLGLPLAEAHQRATAEVRQALIGPR
ncbi:MAG TPA: nickel pincer cofactor biosynthesis protein LarC [Candidatus Dormibacteraeota bacterium]|nr:nickel pincer cofactor biosynthesis protein LarC [Candidatus Dormibacteraeota bacterium]